MIKLNLKANGIEQEKIKEYLENNVTKTLADKINNGVKITKDNKTLINKKDLNGFWKYATEEARKQADKNSRGAYVEDSTVYGWAIHYFEEDSIECNLFNEDGSEYKVVPKITTPPKPKQEVKKEQPKEENKQATLFDFFDNPTPTEEKVEEIETVEELEEETMQEEIVDIPIEENKKENLIIDMETGEILTQNEQISSFDDEVTTSLFSIFQNILEVK